MPKDFSSAHYWQKRYKRGGNSGAGSYGRLAGYKADYINDLVEDRSIDTVYEMGFGDGNQSSLFDFPNYVATDVSELAVDRGAAQFSDRPGWAFYVSGQDPETTYDLTMSLDVIYHLVEDEVFEGYVRELFAKSRRYVLIYASNHDEQHKASHVRHRHFTKWITENLPQATLIETPEHPYASDPEDIDPKDKSFASFYLYEVAS
ncbi:MAG: hypothetical protein HRU30_18655 [Rhodobacteraceae bacterium]|nr:hypothetical protein [Paracoccaceae bacterium]